MKHSKLILFLSIFVMLFTSCNERDKDVTILAIGDSIIARWPLDATLPSQLVYNYGLSGSGIEYIEKLSIYTDTNDVAMVMIGTNDKKYYLNEPVDEYVERYLSAISRIDCNKIYLYSILPRRFATEPAEINKKIANLNAKIQEALPAYPKIEYIDVFDSFMDGDDINYQYYTDGLHLNDYGYEILSSALLKRLN